MGNTFPTNLFKGSNSLTELLPENKPRPLRWLIYIDVTSFKGLQRFSYATQLFVRKCTPVEYANDKDRQKKLNFGNLNFIVFPLDNLECIRRVPRLPLILMLIFACIHSNLFPPPPPHLPDYIRVRARA